VREGLGAFAGCAGVVDEGVDAGVLSVGARIESMELNLLSVFLLHSLRGVLDALIGRNVKVHEIDCAG
jgi:hypothetical protein